MLRGRGWSLGAPRLPGGWQRWGGAEAVEHGGVECSRASRQGAPPAHPLQCTQSTGEVRKAQGPTHPACPSSAGRRPASQSSCQWWPTGPWLPAAAGAPARHRRAGSAWEVGKAGGWASGINVPACAAIHEKTNAEKPGPHLAHLKVLHVVAALQVLAHIALACGGGRERAVSRGAHREGRASVRSLSSTSPALMSCADRGEARTHSRHTHTTGTAPPHARALSLGLTPRGSHLDPLTPSAMRTNIPPRPTC